MPLYYKGVPMSPRDIPGPNDRDTWGRGVVPPWEQEEVCPDCDQVVCICDELEEAEDE